MADRTADLKATDAAQKVVDSKGDRLSNARDEVNKAWSDGNLDFYDIGSDLEKRGILGKLILVDKDNLDINHDGTIDQRELTMSAFSDSADNMTKTVAQYLAMKGEDVSLDEVKADVDKQAKEQEGPRGEERDKYASELKYASDNFDKLDTDGNGFVTSAEIGDVLKKSAGTMSESEATMLRDLSKRVGKLEGENNDETGPENDGFTRNDILMGQVGAGEPPEGKAALTGDDAKKKIDEMRSGDKSLSKNDSGKTDDGTSSDDDKGEKSALSTLSDQDATSEQKLAAIKTLADAGQTSVTITDADGSTIQVRLSVQPISKGSDKEFVQMFAVDGHGKESVIMRAVSDGDSFVHQRDAKGNYVSFFGTKWQKDHPDSIYSD
ncbi:MAG: hypothetical protein JST89_26390 [Cyanobacteria bacterium SZAS-4]|nr:hypothetical protein [Cyanobacteria bacterium SZAS-4]